MVMFSPGGGGGGERAENKDWLEPINSREMERNYRLNVAPT